MNLTADLRFRRPNLVKFDGIKVEKIYIKFNKLDLAQIWYLRTPSAQSGARWYNIHRYITD